MSTVLQPITMTSGGPTQVAMSPTRAAGSIPISTVGQPGGRIGPPTCGTIPVTIGQTCMSVIRDAGGIFPCLLLELLVRSRKLIARVGHVGVLGSGRGR